MPKRVAQAKVSPEAMPNQNGRAHQIQAIDPTPESGDVHLSVILARIGGVRTLPVAKEVAGIDHMPRNHQSREERLPVVQGGVQVVDEQGRMAQFAFDNRAKG